MPSYRTILTITGLHPGQRPEAVETAARAAVLASSTLEAFQVDVVRGEPRVTIRFTGVDDADAREIHQRTVTAVREVANAPRAVLGIVRAGKTIPIV